MNAAHSTSPAELKQRLEAEAAGWPFLIYRDATSQQILTLAEGTQRATVGRGGDVDIGLDFDENVSRLHAELERIGGQWTVSDDGLSRNGSFVNDHRVSGRRRLRDGDVMRFGSTLVEFKAPIGSAGSETAIAPDTLAPALSETQRKILIALCRPYREGSSFATPATNQEIGAEVFLSLDAVKGHLRALFAKFGIGDLPQNQKRARLVELTMQSGLISPRDLT